MNEKTWSGVQVFIDRELKLNQGDSVTIAFSSLCTESAAWLSVALDERKIYNTQIPFKEILDSGFSLRLKEGQALPTSPCGRHFVISLEENTLSHTNAIKDVLNDGAASSANMCIQIMGGNNFFFESMLYSPSSLLHRKNLTLLSHLTKEKNISIKTKSGTNLSVSLDGSQFDWICNSGLIGDEDITILPAGEIATYPSMINGLLVADYALHLNNLVKFPTNLDSTPVEIIIENSTAKHWHCKNPEVQFFLNSYFEDDLARNVGELGIGTNPGALYPTGVNSHLDERRCGVHIGFGQHNQQANVSYVCQRHLDLICSDGIIICSSGEVIDLHNFELLSEVDGRRFRTQDVFPAVESGARSCCGTNSSDEISCKIHE
jgi:hypothetical protein